MGQSQTILLQRDDPIFQREFSPQNIFQMQNTEQNNKAKLTILIQTKKPIFTKTLAAIISAYRDFYQVFVASQNPDQFDKILQEALSLGNDLVDTLVEVIIQIVKFFKQNSQITEPRFKQFSDLVEILSIPKPDIDLRAVDFQGVDFQERVFNNFEKSKGVLNNVLNQFLQECIRILRSSQQKQVSDLSVLKDILIYCLFQLKELFSVRDYELVRRLLKYDIYKIKRSGQSREKDTFLGKSVLEERPIPNTFQVQKISFGKTMRVFPQLVPFKPHRVHMINASKAYPKISPWRINKIIISNQAANTKFFEHDYFSSDSPKVLHYFQGLTKNLHLFYLQDYMVEGQSNPIVVNLNISFNIAPYYRSVITPKAQIFILTSRKKKDQLDNTFYQYDPDTKSLKARPSLPHPRKNYSLIYFKRSIFVIGGTTAEQICTKSCISYDISKRKWYSLAELNLPVKNCALSIIQNRFVIRFGGMNEFDYIDKSIESYDSNFNCWTFVKISNQLHSTDKDFSIFPTAVPLNSNEILILGGLNSNKLLYYQFSNALGLFFINRTDY